MLIPLTEPTAPRYIYINPLTNRVHLMLPVVSGTGIGLDNPKKSSCPESPILFLGFEAT